MPQWQQIYGCGSLLFLFLFLINALGRPYWCAGHFFPLLQFIYLFINIFLSRTSISFSFFIPLHSQFPLSIRFLSEGHINQLINYSFASSILFLINPFFGEWHINQLINYSSDSSILFLINPFFGEGHINQLINYSSDSSSTPYQSVFLARDTSISL